MSDLGPKPEPRIEPGEPNPGGVDALPEVEDHSIPDLSPDENPAIDEKATDPLMESVKEGEDTSTRATRSDDGDDGHEHQPEKESPA